MTGPPLFNSLIQNWMQKSFCPNYQSNQGLPFIFPPPTAPHPRPMPITLDP